MVRKAMSIFNLSQAAADAIFGYANVAMMIGAAIVLIGTIGAIWSGGIRERYANERISNE